jgi:hypothetical protein
MVVKFKECVAMTPEIKTVLTGIGMIVIGSVGFILTV